MILLASELEEAIQICIDPACADTEDLADGVMERITHVQLKRSDVVQAMPVFKALDGIVNDTSFHVVITLIIGAKRCPIADVEPSPLPSSQVQRTAVSGTSGTILKPIGPTAACDSGRFDCSMAKRF